MDISSVQSMQTDKSTSMSDPYLRLQGINHWFEKNGQPFKVLQDINEQIHRNEFVSIVGPSGCGKSTLLFIIAGFIIPSEGQVWHGSRLVTEPGQERGIVFQADAVFPWLTVFENVEFGLKARNIPAAERREIVNRYIHLVQLSGSERLYPKQLSGGMKKRLDVARTFANDPDILLLDESFGSLDAQTKETLQLELLQLWEQEKKTAVFVTHDIEEAVFLADYVLIMGRNPGRIVEKIDIPFERPRQVELKTVESFQRLRQEIREIMSKL